MANRTDHLCCRVLAGVMALGLALVPTAGHGQGLAGKGFSIVVEHYDAPHRDQAKTLLQGETWTNLTTRQVLLTRATLRTFRETGEGEMVIQAPQCFYDGNQRTASSPGQLRVQTADGKFSIEGEGFLWRQTNSSLFISNRVHTIIQPDMLQSPSLSTLPRTNAPTPETESIHILADQFAYAADSHLGIYQGNVRVDGTNLALTSSTLTVQVPMRERQLQRITAETNVIADYRMEDGTNVHATGDRADYSADTGLLRVSGHPAWQAGLREGRGDVLVIDRTNKVFYAEGQAWLRMPGQGPGSSVSFPGYNSEEPASAPTTNQFIEILSRNYEIHTNWAIFRGDVRVKELRDDRVESTMDCGLMTVTFTGTNQLESLVAETNVVIERQDPKEPRRLTGGRAVYTGTNGLLVLTQEPAWQVGPREGRGEVIVINVQTKEMAVRTNAFMRLPAAEFAAATFSGSARPEKAAPKVATNEFARIYSKEYTLQPEDIRFRGGVNMSHPQMNLSCETLTAHRAPGGQVDWLNAEQTVTFDLRNDKGQTVHGLGDKAVYSYDVIDAVTNDILRLLGNPATLTMTNGTATNDVIIWDRAHSTLSTPGKYVIHVRSSNTNALQWPGKKLGKKSSK